MLSEMYEKFGVVLEPVTSTIRVPLYAIPTEMLFAIGSGVLFVTAPPTVNGLCRPRVPDCPRMITRELVKIIDSGEFGKFSNVPVQLAPPSSDSQILEAAPSPRPTRRKIPPEPMRAPVWAKGPVIAVHGLVAPPAVIPGIMFPP
ncbi:hypothetical protein D3C86_1657160 [compost metagenome]